MTFLEIFIIGVGLAMDAFAVSLCKGLTTGKATVRQGITAGLWFGGFQALMPLIGYLLGSAFKDVIASVDHWIAFVLLMWIGINAIRSAREEESVDNRYDWRGMLPLAVATSIDALATGVMFSFMQVKIIPAVSCIGITTGILSYIGIQFGAYLGERFQKSAQIFGGLVLIFIAFKILFEHLGII